MNSSALCICPILPRQNPLQKAVIGVWLDDFNLIPRGTVPSDLSLQEIYHAGRDPGSACTARRTKQLDTQ